MTGLRHMLEGIIKFRQTVQKDLVKQFDKIRNNPNPLAVLFTCMDSRILPARFVQAQVGDMFVVRNSGNMIPNAENYGTFGYEVSITTEPAALELAVKRGKIRHVIVCGHSDCKAINTLYNLHQCPHNFDPSSPMDHWLRRHGHESIEKLLKLKKNLQTSTEVEFGTKTPLIRFTAYIDPNNSYNIEDKLSQINTLQQLSNIASHGFLQQFLIDGTVQLHAFWFDIYTGNMHMFSKIKKKFILIDEETVNYLLFEVEQHNKN